MSPTNEAVTPPARVLLVEDDLPFVELLRASFAVPVEILHAATIVEAQRVLDVTALDIVVLDRRLPDGLGTDLITAVVTNPEHSLLPVMVLAGTGDAADRLAALRAGAVDYVAKDVGIAEIIGRIEAQLSAQRRWHEVIRDHRTDFGRILAATWTGRPRDPREALRRMGPAMAGTLGVVSQGFVIGDVSGRWWLTDVTAHRPAGTRLISGAPLDAERARELLVLADSGLWDWRNAPVDLLLRLGAPPGLSLLAITTPGAPRTVWLIAYDRDVVRRERLVSLAFGLIRAVVPTSAEQGIPTPAVDIALMRPVFHPVIDLRDGHTVGAEALARFPGDLQPMEVFSAARQQGRLVETELDVVDRQLAAGEGLPEDIWISTNVSPETLEEGDLRAHLPSGRQWVVELTEHLPVHDYARIIDAIRQAGTVRLAIDDAGAGYSSLGHILALTPTMVKLDRGWVTGIDRDPSRQALVVGMKHFTDEIGALLIAEGIQSQAELATVRRLGVPFGQGFLFGPPGPAETVPDAVPVG